MSDACEDSGDRMDKKDLQKWGTELAWATGVAVIIAHLVATPGGIPKWSVIALVPLGGLCFSVGVIGHGWVKRPHTVREAARTVAVFILIWGGMIGLGRAIWPKDQGRHLSQKQKEGLAKARDNFPQNCGMLVYVPIESTEAQNYGKEIQAALQAHGLRANLIHAGAVDPPVGVVVGIRSVTDSCGFTGENLSATMTYKLQIPARLQESFTPYVNETTVIVFVGIKPNYD